MEPTAELLYRAGVAGGTLLITSVAVLFVRRHHRQRGGWLRPLLVFGCVTGVLLIAGSAFGAVWREHTFNRLLDASEKVAVPNLRPPENRPPLEPMNFLVLGTDSRSLGDYAQDPDGPVEDNNADVIMIVMIDPGGGRATILSIPRDYYVEIPGYGPRKINAALSLGGPELQVATVVELTGIRIDHYAEVDFAGFVHIVDEFGGVEVCVERPMRDRVLAAYLPAGCTHVDGIGALNFVRSRHTEFEIEAGVWEVDPEGDLSRIHRQQQFLDRLFDRAMARTAIAHYPRYAENIGRALTFDSTFTVGDLIHLVDGFARPGPDAVTYLSLPGIADNYQGVSYVFALTPDADRMLVALGGHPVPDSALPFGRNVDGEYEDDGEQWADYPGADYQADYPDASHLGESAWG